MKLQKSNKWTKLYPEAKTSVTQQPTIAVDGGLPVQYIIQAPNFAKLRKIPLFMEEVENNPTFSNSDVNLKFNRTRDQCHH
jgi:HAE1 family hydrophobic/amphiphilic exporter-1/multidrug efflux pump